VGGLHKRYGSRRLWTVWSSVRGRGKSSELIVPMAPAKTARFTSSLGLIEPSDGQGAGAVAGRHEARERIGYLPSSFSQYPDLV